MPKPIASQAKTLTHEISGRFAMIVRIAANAAKGSHGTHGTLKRRGCSGWLFRKHITQMETRAKATRTPFAIRSDASPTSIRPANSATAVPPIQTHQCGVLVLECKEEK